MSKQEDCAHTSKRFKFSLTGDPWLDPDAAAVPALEKLTVSESVPTTWFSDSVMDTLTGFSEDIGSILTPVSFDVDSEAGVLSSPSPTPGVAESMSWSPAEEPTVLPVVDPVQVGGMSNSEQQIYQPASTPKKTSIDPSSPMPKTTTGCLNDKYILHNNPQINDIVKKITAILCVKAQRVKNNTMHHMLFIVTEDVEERNLRCRSLKMLECDCGLRMELKYSTCERKCHRTDVICVSILQLIDNNITLVLGFIDIENRVTKWVRLFNQQSYVTTGVGHISKFWIVVQHATSKLSKMLVTHGWADLFSYANPWVGDKQFRLNNSQGFSKHTRKWAVGWQEQRIPEYTITEDPETCEAGKIDILIIVYALRQMLACSPNQYPMFWHNMRSCWPLLQMGKASELTKMVGKNLVEHLFNKSDQAKDKLNKISMESWSQISTLLHLPPRQFAKNPRKRARPAIDKTGCGGRTKGKFESILTNV